SDKWEAQSDLPHDFIVLECSKKIRYVKLTINQLPYDQKPAISGLRIFGKGNGEKPIVPSYTVDRISELDAEIKITPQNNNDARGYNILFGNSPEKLYNSYMISDKT